MLPASSGFLNPLKRNGRSSPLHVMSVASLLKHGIGLETLCPTVCTIYRDAVLAEIDLFAPSASIEVT